MKNEISLITELKADPDHRAQSSHHQSWKGNGGFF